MIALSTTEDRRLFQTPQGGDGRIKLTFGNRDEYDFWGFGGCFNELGYEAIKALSEEKRKKAFSLFFSEEDLNFKIGRIPIGANDFASSWYSLCDKEDDFKLESFSIERDRKGIIEYIRNVCKNPDEVLFFASPWSPPVWMKHPKAYNYGKLIWEEKYLEAYAKYFVEFVKAYKKEGITVSQIHPQNEPRSDQKFPSCLWTGKEMEEFIRDYLHPAFQKAGLDTEIWLGTINAPAAWDGDVFWQKENYSKYAGQILLDEKIESIIKGISYQWGGKEAIRETHLDYPELPLLQSESECGNGENSFEYAKYTFSLVKHYLDNGVRGYTYWNMALKKDEVSTWGWKQNSLISIDEQKDEIIYNNEYYLMYHLSHYLKKGARRLEVEGRLSSQAVAFENPDGDKVLIILNPYEREIGIEVESEKLVLPESSFTTIILKKNPCPDGQGS